jgi:hypothetical protein
LRFIVPYSGINLQDKVKDFTNAVQIIYLGFKLQDRVKGCTDEVQGLSFRVYVA